MTNYSAETRYTTRRNSARSLVGIINVIALLGLALGLVVGVVALGADPASGVLVIGSVVFTYLWTRLWLAAVMLLADIHEMAEAREA